MKKIECIIRQEKLRDVAEKLRILGVGGMTVTEVKGFGTQTTRPENYLFLPKTKIEMYISDEQVEEVIEAITQSCRDDSMGSGKLAILPIDDCVRIRTAERGEQALF